MKILGDVISIALDFVNQLLNFFDEMHQQGYLILFIGAIIFIGFILILLAIF